jgi:hypothetical protein
MSAPPPQQQPIVEKIKTYIPDTNDVKEAISSVGTSISTGLDNAKTGVQNTLGEFSQKGVTNASNEFLESNGLFAKFAFIILVFILFLFLFKLGISMIGYLTKPSTSPYIIKGMLDGHSSVTVPQDPNVEKSVSIIRSDNAKTGVEFTWSVWLYLKLSPDAGKYYTIFVKGPNTFNTDGSNSINGPGMYAIMDANGVCTIRIAMDDVDNRNSVIDVDNVPLNKWVHVAYRLQNTILDTYINGSISKRLQMNAAPRQNFYDILVAANGGFAGSLSNLQYFSRALNVFEINNIVMFGPNLTVNSQSKVNSATGNYSYLSTSWYTGWYNVVR